jgi:hypothetical protein
MASVHTPFGTLYSAFQVVTLAKNPAGPEGGAAAITASALKVPV